MAKQPKEIKLPEGKHCSIEGPLVGGEVDPAKASAEARGEAADKIDSLPSDLSVQATIDWVGNDKARAKIALDSENSSGGPRRTLVSELERLLTEQTGAGVVSNEA